MGEKFKGVTSSRYDGVRTADLRYYIRYWRGETKEDWRDTHPQAHRDECLASDLAELRARNQVPGGDGHGGLEVVAPARFRHTRGAYPVAHLHSPGSPKTACGKFVRSDWSVLKASFNSIEAARRCLLCS